jgi:hypothetical protein
MEVEDLFTDLADGRKLLMLLEIISSEKLGKPNNGKMRVHNLDNVNKSLTFLHTKARCLTACLLACFEGLTLALMKVQVFWDVTLFEGSTARPWS